MHQLPNVLTNESMIRFERERYREVDRGLGAGPVPLAPAVGSGPSRNELIELIKQSGTSSLALLRRGLSARVISLTAGVAKQVVLNQLSMRGFIVLNPASALAGGITSTGTILAAASRVVGSYNSQAAGLGVANFSDMHIFLNVTNVGAGGTVTVNAQAQDPVSGNWANTQMLFSAINAIGTYYAELGQLGVTSNFAINSIVATDTVAYSVGYVLKNGLPGTATGTSRTIYLGGPNVSTVSGLPLLEGQSWTFYMDENVELWAVSPSTVSLNLFEMGT